MSTECETSVEQEDCSQYKKGGYHPVQAGDLFESRYLVLKKIGWGHFSTVWLCLDQIDSTYVALKISKSAVFYSDAAVSEMNVLQHISETQKAQNLPVFTSNKSYIVNLLNSFTHRGPNGRHVILVFEILGINLLEVIKIYEYKGLPLDISRSFLLQILRGLDFLHRICGVIHTDLKPENILLELTKTQLSELMKFGEVKTQIKRRVERIEAIQKPLVKAKEGARKVVKKLPLKKKGKAKTVPKEEEVFSDKLAVKIVDFGNSVFESGNCANEIQTRQYRAPEVILGYRYGCLADMWSFGCIAFELVTGELMFQPRPGEGYNEDDDHLASIWETIGSFPLDWGKASKFGWKFFSRDGLKKSS